MAFFDRTACFAVAGVQICLLNTKKLSSPNIGATAKQATLSKKQYFKYHIYSKIRVVGHPKMIKFRGGRLFCYRLCFHMLVGYKKLSSPNI